MTLRTNEAPSACCSIILRSRHGQASGTSASAAMRPSVRTAAAACFCSMPPVLTILSGCRGRSGRMCRRPRTPPRRVTPRASSSAGAATGCAGFRMLRRQLPDKPCARGDEACAAADACARSSSPVSGGNASLLCITAQCEHGTSYLHEERVGTRSRANCTVLPHGCCDTLVRTCQGVRHMIVRALVSLSSNVTPGMRLAADHEGSGGGPAQGHGAQHRRRAARVQAQRAQRLRAHRGTAGRDALPDPDRHSERVLPAHSKDAEGASPALPAHLQGLRARACAHLWVHVAQVMPDACTLKALWRR